MRLERLEITGFKSFSDRSELAFDQGVTAIVGPNGCGKSNVADAITWVLGEQSAKSLRGDKMEDVIFSGSDARKPGATAEVRLRLTGLPTRRRRACDAEMRRNSSAPSERQRPWQRQRQRPRERQRQREWPRASRELPPTLFTRDVEVTRRLYRSGESEYLIDGEVCRLRDVHELLMDTGLGAKAYAIIEQGKIGMILSSRPADRRQLIEEAAGITKYKSRRRAAELKLEAAQQNLTRIDDIVFEVEKQRGALKRQAAKARRYKRLREELRRWEKVLFARRYRELAQTHRAGAGAAGRGARARDRRGRARRRSRGRSGAAAHRAGRGGQPRRRRPRGRPRARARHQPPAAAAGVQPPPGGDAGRPRRPRSPTSSASSRRAASRRASRSSRAAGRRRGRARARRGGWRRWPTANDALRAGAAADRRARRRRRGGPRATCSRR